jgi:hypothetical protein
MAAAAAEVGRGGGELRRTEDWGKGEVKDREKRLKRMRVERVQREKREGREREKS